jgi:hypothetical protein
MSVAIRLGDHVKNLVFRRPWIAEPLYRLRERVVERYGRWQLKRHVAGTPCKLIVAAAGRRRRAWISTDQEFLDLLREEDWQRHFTPNSIDAIVAEHVWEHLT